MPVKLERALKRQATEKGLKGERKDAYVFGTLRRTGWKPNREKKMNVNDEKLVRLAAIDNRLAKIIEFDVTVTDDDDLRRQHPFLTGVGIAAGGTAAVGGGAYGLAKLNQYANRTYGGVPSADIASKIAAAAKSGTAPTFGQLGTAAKATAGAYKNWGKSLLARLRGIAAPAVAALSSKDDAVRLEAKVDRLIHG